MAISQEELGKLKDALLDPKTSAEDFDEIKRRLDILEDKPKR